MQKTWEDKAGWLLSVSVAFALHALLFNGWSSPLLTGSTKPAPVMETFMVMPVATPAAATPVSATVPPLPLPAAIATKPAPQKVVRKITRPHRPERAPTTQNTQTATEAKAATAKTAITKTENQSVSATATTAQPVLIKKPQFLLPPTQPLYPPVARRRGQQGTVLLEILLSETGKQMQLSIVRSSGFQSLDDAAKVAVAGWKLAPYRMNGVAVSSRVQVPIEFMIQ